MKTFLKLFICGWLFGAVALGGYLHSLHQGEFSSHFELKQNQSIPTQISKWNLIHILGGQCSCSRRVAKYLSERGLIDKNIHETVVLLDDPFKNEIDLRTKDFTVLKKTLKEMQLSDSELSGVPLFIVVNPDGQTVYAGGYSDSSITPFTEFQDLKILNSLKEGRKLASLPIKGCAVSEKYKKILDPLGIKYEENRNAKLKF